MNQKINPDKISSCSNNPEDKAEDPNRSDNTFMTFEEIRSKRQTAQSKYLQKKYFTAIFGEKK